MEFISLKRPHTKMIKDAIVTLGPPTVLDKDNNEYKEQTNVGNGSTVTCKVVVYDTVKGKGHTLEAVRVDDLVVFDKNEVDVIDSPF